MDRFALCSAVLLAMAMVGCGDDDETGDGDAGGGDRDTGPVVEIDSGPSDVDSGPSDVDSGPSVDSGPGVDSGPADVDGGPAPMCLAAGGMGCAGEGATPCCEGLMCCAGIPLPDEGRCLMTESCPISDRNVKHGFAPVDTEAVLETVARLPISTWEYDFEPGDVRHMGPMAQDFHAAFGLGATDRMIGVIDSGGVSLAAIQALRNRTERLATENERLRDENARLRSELDVIDARLEALERR